MSAVLVLSALVLLYGGFLVISLIQEEDNSVTGWLTDITAEMFPIIQYTEDGTETWPKGEGQLREYKKWRRQNREGVVQLKTDGQDGGEEVTGGTD